LELECTIVENCDLFCELWKVFSGTGVILRDRSCATQFRETPVGEGRVGNSRITEQRSSAEAAAERVLCVLQLELARRCLGGIHMVVSMAIYSSSPPTTWHIQNATSNKTAMATKDMDLHTPPHAHHQSSKSLLQGGGGGAGLSIMFSTTNNMRRRKYAFSSDDSGSPFATSCVVGFEMRNTDAAREKVLQFVEEFNGLSTSSSSTPSHAAAAVEVCDSKLRLLPPSSATTKLLLLESAQAQHRVFCDPCVVKAYRLAEDSHKGQVRKPSP
jgi:hypothetical protein